ncbi:aminotransferase class I/II-fold pyridoxal phosphate-dependent enzyme [Vibrio lentus]|nr:aminotransferase class I/II-fold pyridoxal phosphate-dependent enzyme [Vibrio lentus]
MLRQALSTHFAKPDVHFSPEEMVITAGCMSAIKAALNRVPKKVTPLPSAHLVSTVFWSCLARCPRQIIEIPPFDDGVDLQQLETHLKTSVWMLPSSYSHMNPQGINMSASQKQKLAELANHYRVPIIEDDVSRAFIITHTIACKIL